MRQLQPIRSPHIAADTLGDFLADRDNVALHPRFHRVTLKNCANQYKQTEWRQRNEKIVGSCHNFAPKALQEAFLKVGQWESMVKDMDLLKRRVFLETITVVARRYTK